MEYLTITTIRNLNKEIFNLSLDNNLLSTHLKRKNPKKYKGLKQKRQREKKVIVKKRQIIKVNNKANRRKSIK